MSLRFHAERAIDIITHILPEDHLLLASSKRVKGNVSWRYWASAHCVEGTEPGVYFRTRIMECPSGFTKYLAINLIIIHSSAYISCSSIVSVKNVPEMEIHQVFNIHIGNTWKWRKIIFFMQVGVIIIGNVLITRNNYYSNTQVLRLAYKYLLISSGHKLESNSSSSSVETVFSLALVSHCKLLLTISN